MEKATAMETQILEGTFTEVQRQLSALPLKPKAHLRLIVTETESAAEIEKIASPEEILFANAPRRNGLILVPTKEPECMVTAEMVKVLSED